MFLKWALQQLNVSPAVFLTINDKIESSGEIVTG